MIHVGTNWDCVGAVVENNGVHVSAVSRTMSTAMPQRLSLVPPSSFQYISSPATAITVSSVSSSDMWFQSAKPTFGEFCPSTGQLRHMHQPIKDEMREHQRRQHPECTHAVLPINPAEDRTEQ